MTDRPWYQWYPQDWRGEDRLKLCKLAARGLWRELLDAMHFAEPRGYLLVKGRAHTEKEIAQLVGATTTEVRRLLAELEAHRVFSRTDQGVIYSRRMVRDEQKRLRNTANGEKGGNPKLAGSDMPSVNRPKPKSDKPSDNAHAGARDRVPESRNQKELPRLPHARELLAAWNATVKHLPQATMTPGRETQSTARLKDRPALDEWAAMFARMDASSLLRGERPNGKHQNWLADYDFAVKPDTFAKVMEGKYDDRLPGPRDVAKPDDVWARVLERVEVRVDRHTFGRWFAVTALVSDDGDHLVVSVPNVAHAEWLSRKHSGDVKAALADLGRPEVQVRFTAAQRRSA